MEPLPPEIVEDEWRLVEIPAHVARLYHRGRIDQTTFCMEDYPRTVRIARGEGESPTPLEECATNLMQPPIDGGTWQMRHKEADIHVLSTGFNWVG